MHNGDDFDNYSFEKNDIQENNWKFVKFVPPLDESYRDSNYVKEFNSRNLSLVPRVAKVFIRDISTESGTSTPFAFRAIPDFDGFKEYSEILPYRQYNYEFEKCLQKLENEEFRDFVDLPSYNVADYYLSLDVEEDNVSNVIPLPDADIVDDNDDDFQITFIKLKGASKFGNDILVDNVGYIYSLTHTKFKDDEFLFRQNWRCNKRTSYRGNKLNCNAYVRIIRDSNDPNKGNYIKFNEHNHESDGNAIDMRQLRFDLKQQCLIDPLANPKALIQEYYVNNVDFKSFCSQNNLLTVNALVQMIRRERIKFAPPRVRDVFFDIEERHLPDSFLKADVIVDNDARHLMFFTDEQLYYLGHQKMWFIDGTFKIIAPPFMQLLSINVIVAYNDNKLVIPVCYIFMTRRRKIDYINVFTTLANIIQNLLLKSPDVKVIMCDFERAFWSAWRHLFEQQIYVNVRLRGCYFHFTQAVFRKLMCFGLKGRYFNDVGTKHFCKKLMALPLLPEKDIVTEFGKLQVQTDNLKIEKLSKLVDYMKKNWINGKMWSIPDFCHYRMKIRTNNDVEASHVALMSHSRVGSVPFYLLVKQLYRESQYFKFNVVRMWQHESLSRKKNKQKKREEFLSVLWEKLDVGRINATEFLDMYAKTIIVNEQFAADESRIDLEDDE